MTKYIQRAKNLLGWKTDRKLVLISADDYGNVRIRSEADLNSLRNTGFNIGSRFDFFDALETRSDLEALYGVLTSVKDVHGNSAVFTPYALPCNLDFKSVLQKKIPEYIYELLPVTFDKLEMELSSEYEGAMKMWKQGIAENIMHPQFHGREHINIHWLEDKLKARDKDLFHCIQQQSLVELPSNNQSDWTAAFSNKTIQESETYLEIIRDGLNQFQEVYGVHSKTFTPPAQKFPQDLIPELKSLGIEAIHRPFFHNAFRSNGRKFKQLNWLAKQNGEVFTIVRNVVFEPTSRVDIDWVGLAFSQINAAFSMGKPAHISTHRVNYSGFIDEKNRKQGLGSLNQLLKLITQKWPDVEFISVSELVELMKSKK